MSKLLVCIFSYNRPHHLELCLHYVLKAVSEDTEIIIFDDCSDNMDVNKFANGQILVDICSFPNTQTSVRDCAARLASQRRRAVDRFLATDCDYLFFLDDDIIIGETSLVDMIDDLTFFEGVDYIEVGAVTLHGITRPNFLLKVGNIQYRSITISGEANLMMSRRMLETTGNKFNPTHKDGFADLQLKAMRSRGFEYLCRTRPVNEVQHIGIGQKGSIIHREQVVPPPWCQEPYKTVYGRTLNVQGFDLTTYLNLVEEVGGELAPKLYKQNFLEKDNE